MTDIISDLYKCNIYRFYAGTISSFADYTIIFYKDEHWQNLKQKSEKNLNVILECFNQKLSVNYYKTCLLPFSIYSNGLREYDIFSVNINNKTVKVQRSNAVKFSIMTQFCNILRTLLFQFKYFRDFLKFINLTYFGTCFFQSSVHRNQINRI